MYVFLDLKPRFGVTFTFAFLTTAVLLLQHIAVVHGWTRRLRLAHHEIVLKDEGFINYCFKGDEEKM